MYLNKIVIFKTSTGYISKKKTYVKIKIKEHNKQQNFSISKYTSMICFHMEVLNYWYIKIWSKLSKSIKKTLL